MNADFFNALAHRTPRLIGLDGCRASAVCIPLLPDGAGGFDVLLTVRSSRIAEQPGDICLPGGMGEAGETPWETARRELCEELLVQPAQAVLLCPADTLQAGRLLVRSFAVRLDGYENTFSRDEVAEVFRVPLTYFLNTAPETYLVHREPRPAENFPYERICGGKSYRWRDRDETVLFYEYGGRHIWGMTAKLLCAFTDICRNAGEKPAE